MRTQITIWALIAVLFAVVAYMVAEYGVKI